MKRNSFLSHRVKAATGMDFRAFDGHGTHHETLQTNASGLDCNPDCFRHVCEAEALC